LFFPFKQKGLQEDKYKTVRKHSTFNPLKTSDNYTYHFRQQSIILYSAHSVVRHMAFAWYSEENYYLVRFETLTAAAMKMAALWHTAQ
jgi:hypothetical protein